MKTLMDFIVDLSAILKESNDPSMRMQLASAKNDLKQRVDKLTREGYALPQLYAKYGANILRAQIIDANNKIQQANREGEYRVADLLDEDKILQRLAPDVQEQRQELTEAMQYVGFDVKGMPSDVIERLKKVTGSENIAELSDRIVEQRQQRENRLGEIEENKEEQKQASDAAMAQRIVDDKLQKAGDMGKRLGEKLRIVKDTRAAAQIDLPDDDEDEEDEEEKKEEKVEIPAQMMMLAGDSGNIPKVRPRERVQTEVLEEVKQVAKKEEKEKVDTEDPQKLLQEDEETRIETNTAKLSNNEVSLKSLLKGKNRDQEVYKRYVTTEFNKAEDLFKKGTIKKTEKRGQLSFNKQDVEKNTQMINEILLGTIPEEKRKSLQTVLEYYK